MLRLPKMRFLFSLSVALCCVSAFEIRQAPLNLTTIAPWDPTPTEDPGFVRTSSQSRQLRPHPEVSVPGFETTVGRDGPVATTTLLPPPDIGSIIQSFLTTALPAIPVPTVHFEQSASGWTAASPRPGAPSSAAGPHFEVSTGSFGHPTVRQGDDGPQVTRGGPGATVPPYVPIPVVTPPPAITQGGLIFQPVPVTSVRVTTIDGKPTTIDAIVNYEVVVGSTTLAVGSPMTINNIVVALSINPSGSTVLVAGDQTTTLPSPTRATPGAQASGGLQAVSISTTVIQGTTQYILAGQTLAPGQAVTVGDIPISIGTSGGSTVLVMGDKTTTLASAPASTGLEWGPSTAPMPGIVTGNAPNRPAATSAQAGADASHPMPWVWMRLIAIAALLQPFV
ncbi:hypothetical protein HBI42_021150 [Parastagonospora nodorum]|nr:hypothetical protein HBI43_013730 [Parastagonospora nodorum]KAH6272849.1 hypothetical protein HBI42_021150 [Parastagonospora nodorum]